MTLDESKGSGMRSDEMLSSASATAGDIGTKSAWPLAARFRVMSSPGWLDWRAIRTFCSLFHIAPNGDARSTTKGQRDTGVSSPSISSSLHNAGSGTWVGRPLTWLVPAATNSSSPDSPLLESPAVLNNTLFLGLNSQKTLTVNNTVT